MQKGTVFFIEQYKEAYDFVIKNGLTIDELPAQNGKRVFKIVDIPKISESEKIVLEIESLKNELASTDYQAIKFAEGVLTLAEFDPIREKRKAWREKINFLENSLKNV